MNKRLHAIAQQINPGKGFSDVGTDHGYLPVYMLENGYSGQVFASDINNDPLRCAIHNAQQSGLEDKINFLLCDGLSEQMKDQVDTIVIAGMGGDTICGILDRAEWCMDSQYKLVLQPMSKAEILRYWLSYNDFEITDEVLVDDCGTVYQIICAVYGKRVTLSDAELFVGRYELASAEKLFPIYLDETVRRFQRLLSGLERSKDISDFQRLALNRNIYNELCRMKSGEFSGGKAHENS